MTRDILLYLGAVVGANLFASLGPWHSVFSAFVLIGATLTVRDRLHERWLGKQLALRMGLLIGTAGVLTVLLNQAAARIAFASCAAFVVSESVDALVYHILRRHSWHVKVNGSNGVSAALDSILFPTLAFGSFMPVIILLQYAAKVFGGSIWGYVLRPRQVLAAAILLLLATSANAQIVSANAVWLHNSGVSAPAGELFVASPPIKQIRPYAIFSWNTKGDERPTILVRLGYSRNLGPWMMGIGAGVISLPFDRTPRPTLSVVGMGPRFGPQGRIRPYAVIAREEAPVWTWTTIVGFNVGIYFRK